MWKVVRENPRAVIYAVLMHLLLLTLLIIGLDWSPGVTKPGGSQPIQAQLVDYKQIKAIEDKKMAEQRKAEQLVKQKAEAARKRKADLAAKKKAAAEQAKKQKAEEQRTRKAEAAAKRKAAAARKKKQDAVRQHEAEQALQDELAAEQQAGKVARDQGVVAEYVGYIQEKVRRNWLRPAGSSDDFTCTLEVSLIPGGDVAKVRVLQSCGSAVLDRSVESAVFKAAPLPLPKDSDVFHYFRELHFIFSPG